jgi:hypothetical protein
MNNKHKRTLRAIFEDPVRANIDWKDVEALFVNLEATVSERAGSKIGVYLNGVVGLFDRPHPEKETDKGAVKSVRRFLTNAGFGPEKETK